MVNAFLASLRENQDLAHALQMFAEAPEVWGDVWALLASKLADAVGSAMDLTSQGQGFLREWMVRGKGLRARLALDVAVARQGKVDMRHGLWALAIEGLHAASLLHDDVMDQAETRRGLISVHRQFGTHQAILWGDALFCVALGAVAEIGCCDLVKVFYATAMQLARGQLADVQADWCLDRARALALVRDKTASLFAAASRGVAVLEGCPALERETLHAWAEHLGVAYQLQDDADEYAVDIAQWDAGHDFFVRRVTMPLVLLDDQGRQEVQRLWHQGERPCAQWLARWVVPGVRRTRVLARAHQAHAQALWGQLGGEMVHLGGIP